MSDFPIDDPSFISEAVYQSQAYLTYQRLHLLGLNFYVFAQNYKELETLMIHAQHPDTFMELWIMGKEDKMQRVAAEVMRRFANFLASAKMYVDHTRAVIKDWYAGEDFLKEYDKEVQKRFVGNPLTGFVEDLRNYLLHFELPLTSASVYFLKDPTTEEDIIEQRFEITKEELLKWKNWTQKGKPFLETAGEEIVLLELANKYFNEINQFNEWMLNRIETIHAEDLKWLQVMAERVKNSLDRMHLTDGDK